jgi:hypothetical protein
MKLSKSSRLGGSIVFMGAALGICAFTAQAEGAKVLKAAIIENEPEAEFAIWNECVGGDNTQPLTHSLRAHAYGFNNSLQVICELTTPYAGHTATKSCPSTAFAHGVRLETVNPHRLVCSGWGEGWDLEGFSSCSETVVARPFAGVDPIGPCRSAGFTALSDGVTQ